MFVVFKPGASDLIEFKAKKLFSRNRGICLGVDLLSDRFFQIALNRPPELFHSFAGPSYASEAEQLLSAAGEQDRQYLWLWSFKLGKIIIPTYKLKYRSAEILSKLVKFFVA